MAKQFFRRWLPSTERISRSKILSIFGQHLLNPQIWYINRKSITKAMFIGTFFGLIPIPFHSLFIVVAVLLLRVNLPLSLMMCWLSNPLTIVPIIYVSFWTGTQIFQVHMIDEAMLKGVLHQISDWITHFGQGYVDLSLAKILIVGMITVAFITALLLTILTNLYWRYSVQRAWRKRQKLMAATQSPSQQPQAIQETSTGH